MPQKDSPQKDHLWQTLAAILAFYKLPVRRDLLETQVAIDWSRPLTPDDLLRIARHLGFEVSVQSIAGRDLAAVDRPTIAFLSDQHSVLAIPRVDTTPELISYSDAPQLDQLRQSEQRNLYAMAFDRIKTAESAEGPAGARWFWELFWQRRRDYADVGLATFFINLFALLMPLFSMNVLDRVIPNRAHETLIALTIGICGAYIFNFGFRQIRHHVLGDAVTRLAVKLDANFMDQLLRLNDVSNRLTIGEKFNLFHEMQSLRDFFAARFLPAVVDVPFFLLFLVIIYVISPPVAMVVLVGVVLLVGVALAVRTSVARTATASFRESRNKHAMLVEMLTGASAARLFNAIGSQLLHWRRLSDRVAKTTQHSSDVVGLADDIGATIMYLTSVFVIVVAVNEIEKGMLTIGGLIACNILVGRTLAPIMMLASVLGRLRQSLDSLKIIDRIFHMPAEAKIAPDYVPKAPFKGRLLLKDVSYYYPGQVHPTLYHMNLEVRAGEKVGLIGRTGAGKSTITRLFDGSLEPSQGQVLVDDYPIKSVHPAEWRQYLGVVPQDSFLFSGTVRENILFGATQPIDEEAVAQAVKYSGLETLMAQTGFTLDTAVGEMGARLSGGQKQAVAIARALVRRPQILLFDEPTNGMDNDLEQKVMVALQNYAASGKTLVMVTHRTALLSLCDRLVLVDQGRVALDGPRDDVMRQLSGQPPTVRGGANG